MILAIDPGTEKSAWILLYDDGPMVFGIRQNEEVLELCSEQRSKYWACCVIEQFRSMGQLVGQEVFDTVFWSGRFAQAFGMERVYLMPRRDVKMHLCGSNTAKDANIRQALIDKFGGRDAIRKGGPLHGVSKDVWSALALAVTYSETKL